MPRSWSATPQHLQHTVSKRAGDVRLAVRAAHFLKSLREDVEEDYKGKAVVQQGESEAMRLAKQFGYFEESSWRNARRSLRRWRSKVRQNSDGHGESLRVSFKTVGWA